MGDREKKHINGQRDCRKDLPSLVPEPCPEAVSVFIPLFLSISTSSQRKAEMSCLISFTSSSVTPCKKSGVSGVGAMQRRIIWVVKRSQVSAKDGRKKTSLINR